ncbi:MAG: peptidase S8 [Proteobacteria bacterium SG_bin6]|nr:MAG: peptidase S8 [Proteobacteria bacterium SG_bin6]
MRSIVMVAAGLAALAASSAAWGQSATSDLRRSGKIYHARVCPASNAPGVASCDARVVTDAKGNPLVHDRGTPNALPSGYGPSDLRAAYNIPAISATQRTIAIVDAYGYNNAEADLAVYRSTFGLPACTTANGCFRKYNQRGVQGSYPRQNTGWAQETALDLDMASAICPDCRIILVQADSASLANLAAAVRTAGSLGAFVISNSYSGGESGSTTYEAAYNQSGIAITASTGDSGYGVGFPASSNHVIAVGGTSLTRSSTTRGWSESAWSGAGSGCSAVYPKPSWQTDTGCARRSLADISAVADPATGVAVYGPTTKVSTAGWQVYGGTSASAPIIAAAYASQGTSSYAYPVQGTYAIRAYLNDVISGSNGSCGTYLCNAVPGFDGPTGLGTPNGLTAF